MKKSFLITILGVLVAGVALAQSEETRKLSSFSGVAAQEGIDVFIKKGTKEEARVVSRSHDLDEVITEIEYDKLKIHIENDKRWGSNGRVDVDVYVTYVSIESLSASSSASINAEGTVQAEGDFRVKVSSSGDIRAKIMGIDELEVGASSAGDVTLEVEAEDIEASVSSAGDIEIEGTASFVDVESSSAGSFDGKDLTCKEAEVSASSGANISINVTEKLDGRASSGGSVRYKGDPRYVNTNSSSGGSIKKY